MARQKGDGKGQQGGGRKKGTPNKITKEKREMIAKFIEDKWDDLSKDFDKIESPKDRWNIMIGLMPFAFPKLASLEYKDKDKPKTFKDELDDISGEITRQ